MESAFKAWFIVSLAPFTRALPVSKPSSCRKLLLAVKGFAEDGPFHARFRTFGNAPVPMASWRVVIPVSKRLLPETEILIGKTVGPFSEIVLSATRPPQPVCPVVLQIEVICWLT